MQHLVRIFLIVLCCTSLAACGVKKPLYIPTEKDMQARQKRDEYRAQKELEREQLGKKPGDDDDDDDDDDKPGIFNW